MARTIQLADQTVTAIQAIWERDYWTHVDRWHLRVRFLDADVDDEEDANCPIVDMPHDASDAKLIENVAAWLYDLDGMLPADAQAVRDMIEVQR